jgi:hypothetical protein
MNLNDFLKKSFGFLLAVGYIANVFAVSEATTFDAFMFVRCVGVFIIPVGGIVGFF